MSAIDNYSSLGTYLHWAKVASVGLLLVLGLADLGVIMLEREVDDVARAAKLKKWRRRLEYFGIVVLLLLGGADYMECNYDAQRSKIGDELTLPRHLNHEQRASLLAELRREPHPIEIVCNDGGSSEAFDFCVELIKVFVEAGWQTTKRRGQEGDIRMPPIVGLQIDWTMDNASGSPVGHNSAGARVLSEALDHLSLRWSDDLLKVQSPPPLLLIVGQKPAPGWDPKRRPKFVE